MTVLEGGHPNKTRWSDNDRNRFDAVNADRARMTTQGQFSPVDHWQKPGVLPTSSDLIGNVVTLQILHHLSNRSDQLLYLCATYLGSLRPLTVDVCAVR